MNRATLQYAKFYNYNKSGIYKIETTYYRRTQPSLVLIRSKRGPIGAKIFFY